MLPLAVLLSDSFKALRAGQQRVLWLLAAQFDGTNNGDLSLTRKQARAFGMTNERYRCQGLRELEACGFIERTRDGGIGDGGKLPTLWALTWHPIQYVDGRKLEVVRLPPRTWKLTPEPLENRALTPRGRAE